ncbi:MAG: hypothetical protein QOC84_2061 [Bradyrhizobium sp.]|jgi:hypothetical protein|nr:hypothetical protein [Bradyrhizobium sp.]
MRKPRKSTRSNPAGKKAKAKKGAAKKSGGRSAGSQRAAASAALGPAWLDIQSRLEDAAFAQLTPGINLSAADLSNTATFVPGQMRFRLLRPEDLLVMAIQTNDLKFENLALEGGDDPGKKLPHLVPTGPKGGLLIAVFGYQHAAEKAIHEVSGVNGPPEPGDDIPIAARAAHKSWLVFKVPNGEQIPFSIDGIVAAMSRLEMVVAPVARPRAPPRIGPIQQVDALIELAGGIGLAAQDGQLFVQDLTVAKSVRKSAPRSARKQAPTTSSVIAQAQAMHSLRSHASQSSIVDARDKTGFKMSSSAVQLGLVASKIPPAFGTAKAARPRKPVAGETAIEAPFRLVISPSALNGWSHAPAPVAAPADPTRIELWHSRLGVRSVDVKGKLTIDEREQPQKIIRAIWARDLEAQPVPTDNLHNHPFRQSLRASERIIFVRQSAETLTKPTIKPEPVTARGLALSSIGAWLDLYARWDTKPYSARGLPVRQSWDHIATVGRDQYVRVATPGYLFPFGHRAVLVMITERKIKEMAAPQARMYQREFIVVSEPTKYYSGRDLPFTDVRLDPLVTPDLQDTSVIGPEVLKPGELFWPNDSNGLFRWKLHARDQEAKAVRLEAPLLFVGENLQKPADFAAIKSAYEDAVLKRKRNVVDGHGQSVAYAVPKKSGDTANETVTLTFLGTPGKGTSTPHLAEAGVVLPAMRHLTPNSPPTVVKYAAPYLSSGIDGAGNAGEVFLTVTSATQVAFSSTENSGGFVKPDIKIGALSRVVGLAGDPAKAAAHSFDPASFLPDSCKLFGLFKLTELLAATGVDLDKAPSFVTETLSRIAGVVDDLTRLEGVLADAAATTSGAAATQYNNLKNEVSTQLPLLRSGLHDLLSLNGAGAIADVTAKVKAPLDALKAMVTALQSAMAAFPTSPGIKTQLERLSRALNPVLADAGLLDEVLSFVNGLAGGGEFRARLEWRPELFNWPKGTSDADATFHPDPHGLTLAVEVRAGPKAGANVDVFAELRDFFLQLMPGAPLVRANFKRIAFRGGSNRKPEVDVVFGSLEFVGFLSFIETLKQLIPLDGFSDPPFLDVSSDGITAGFTVNLPNVAIGVFSLTNLSLNADTRIPFLGKSVTVGFSFCTREHPFTLAVAFLGGGGFFGIRLSPQGLEVLEMSLEFGAIVALDFGVASGSVSAMAGVYIRLEGDKGSLTGYFRVRGEVDVLGLISACIELYMSLTYEFDTGKLIGRAEISVTVKVLFFSGSVSISCERKFAGSNGDPTVAQMLEVKPDGSSKPWDDYCLAFAA